MFCTLAGVAAFSEVFIAEVKSHVPKVAVTIAPFTKEKPVLSLTVTFAHDPAPCVEFIAV